MNAIPADVGHYIAGFVDGEGSFNVPIRRSSDRSLPRRVGLSFNVSQIGSEQPRMTPAAPGYARDGREDLHADEILYIVNPANTAV